MGDEKGNVSLLMLNRFADTLREWKHSRSEVLVPSISITEAAKHDNVNFYTWKVHKDWVTEVHYSKELNAIISSSNHSQTAICISSMPENTVGWNGTKSSKFKIRDFTMSFLELLWTVWHPKLKPDKNYISISKGVKTFAFASRGNTLVTGGIDRIVRVFNIPSRTFQISKATGFLKGHNNPVIYVGIDQKENRLISASQDNVIRVWDMSEQTCLVVLNPKTHQIKSDFTAMLYPPHLKCLILATDVINLLEIEERIRWVLFNSPFSRQVQSETKMLISAIQAKVSASTTATTNTGHIVQFSHANPITACGYNQTFGQVVTADDQGIVKVWDMETGRKTFEFCAHVPITCLRFDDSHRRLILGCRDGITRVFNHNNGGLLNMLKPLKLGREAGDRLKFSSTHITNSSLIPHWSHRRFPASYRTGQVLFVTGLGSSNQSFSRTWQETHYRTEVQPVLAWWPQKRPQRRHFSRCHFAKQFTGLGLIWRWNNCLEFDLGSFLTENQLPRRRNGKRKNEKQVKSISYYQDKWPIHYNTCLLQKSSNCWPL